MPRPTPSTDRGDRPASARRPKSTTTPLPLKPRRRQPERRPGRPTGPTGPPASQPSERSSLDSACVPLRAATVTMATKPPGLGEQPAGGGVTSPTGRGCARRRNDQRRIELGHRTRLRGREGRAVDGGAARLTAMFASPAHEARAPRRLPRRAGRPAASTAPWRVGVPRAEVVGHQVALPRQLIQPGGRCGPGSRTRTSPPG